MRSAIYIGVGLVLLVGASSAAYLMARFMWSLLSYFVIEVLLNGGRFI